MYAVGDVKGTVRKKPDGARLKVEAQKDAIAAEWPIVRNVDSVIDLIADLCRSPVSYASGDGKSPWVERPLSARRRLGARIRSIEPPEKMRLEGEDCLFLLRRRPSGSYALSIRARSSDWKSVAAPLIEATASDSSQRDLFEMYDEIAR